METKIGKMKWVGEGESVAIEKEFSGTIISTTKIGGEQEPPKNEDEKESTS